MLPLPILIQYVFFLNVIGAMIGAGFVTFAEFFYTLAASDGVIDHHERKYLRHLYHGLTYGMVLVLLSGTLLVVLEYLVPNAPQNVLAAPFWMLETLILLVILFADGLSKEKIGWWLASPAILVGWWMILLLDLGFFNSFGYIVLLFFYVLAAGIGALILGYLRVLMRPHTMPFEHLSSADDSPHAS
jgi:hypothetical protein